MSDGMPVGLWSDEDIDDLHVAEPVRRPSVQRLQLQQPKNPLCLKRLDAMKRHDDGAKKETENFRKIQEDT